MNEQILRSVPVDVDRVVRRYLSEVDAALPDRIEGLYLVGSVALDDYQPGRSDVDFVAVTRTPLTQPEIRVVEDVHCRVHADMRKPHFDGIYVTWSNLESDPMTLSDVPHWLDGRLKVSRGFETNPAVWLTVRVCPVPLRGPHAPQVWHDADLLRRWSLDNLNSYWQQQLSQGLRSYRGMAHLLTGPGITWCVPGVARVHYTIVTGDITSKSGACRYALDTFPPRWHPVVQDALALRNGETTTSLSRFARRREALHFMQFVIDDANSFMAERGGR